MTSDDYNRIRVMIETTFRLDMAALERVWFRVNGCNPPDSLVSLAEKDETPDDPAPRGESTGLRSAESMGIQSAARINAMHQGPDRRRSKLTDEQKKERKAEYMRRYLAKKKAQTE